MNPDLELRLYRLLHGLTGSQEQLQNVSRACWSYLRESHRFFGAAHSCLAVLAEDRRDVDLQFEMPRGGAWDRPLLATFLRDERTLPPDDLLVAPVHRRDRLWGVLAVHRPGRDFERGAGRALARMTRSLSERIAWIDDLRAREVQERIERKIMSRLRPKDIFYQILHGLRSLTGYDHSSALLICTEDQRELELVAEQAAWTKTKSRHVGRRIPIDPIVLRALESGEICGFARDGARWRAWDGRGEPALATLLAYHGGPVPGRGPVEPAEQCMLCAPLWSRDRALGVIKVASRRTDRLGKFEAELLRRFQLHASVTIRNTQETQSLRLDILRAERKHAMVNIARGISHDVNNALGSVLPTVQQMRADVEDGRFDAERLSDDLGQIEAAMRTCRRVFAGLLSFARSRERGVGQGDLMHAIDNTLSIMRGSLERRDVRVRVTAPDVVPMVLGIQHEIEQLFLNLASNARDAMKAGGEIHIEIIPREGVVEVVLRDQGGGMTKEQLRRSYEAFFTTKPSGNGLGLSICRSIVSDMRGRMWIDSQAGAGTTVHLHLPVERGPEQEAAG